MQDLETRFKKSWTSFYLGARFLEACDVQDARRESKAQRCLSRAKVFTKFTNGLLRPKIKHDWELKVNAAMSNYFILKLLSVWFSYNNYILMQK